MDDYPMYGLLVGFSLWGTLWRLLFPLGFWHVVTCRVDTRGGASTKPYSKEEEEKMAAILRERKEKKEAKKKALHEEQAAKLKKIEEEMAREKERLKKAEEEKLKEVDEEEEEDETPLQRKRGQYSGSRDEEMEKRISEWVTNLSLGEEEEVAMYISKDDQEAVMRAWEAEKDVVKRQAMEDEKRMEWRLAVMREKKRRIDKAAEAAEDLEEVQKIEEQLAAQTELPKQMQVIAWNRIAVRSIRLGFRDFARELVGVVGAEVGHRLDKTERFCAGAIEGVKAAAPKEEEPRPRREPVKVKFPDSYSGKREENFDNWEANVKTYVHLQQVSPDQQVLIAIHALRDEAASFARSLVRVANCNDDPVAYSSFTPLTDFMKLLRERFADVARSVKASDKLQTIHARKWKSARALKSIMDELVAVPDHGVTETQLVSLFYRAMPEAFRGHFFAKSEDPATTYDSLSREVVAFEAKSESVSTFWHKDLDKGKQWKGRTISGQVKTKDSLVLTLDEGSVDEIPYDQIEWGLEEEDSGVGQGRTYAAVAAGGRPQGGGRGQGQGGWASRSRFQGDQGVGGRGGNRQAGGRGQGPPQTRPRNRSPYRVGGWHPGLPQAEATLHLKEHECRLPSSSGEANTARMFHVSGVENPLAHCCLSAPAFARLVKKEKLEEQVFVAYVRPVTEPTEEKPMDPAIAKLLEEFKDLTEPPTGVVPRPIQHRIEIEPGSRGVVYRMSPRELEELRKQLDELLEKGWIRPSSSPFGAPVLFVPKKEGEQRMCIDYRGLNAITVKNAEPLPRIDDHLDRVQGAKYFSKIDLKSGYHQIEVHPDDQYKTALRTRYGHYEFIVMPFGLTNAPATFQCCMNDLFRPCATSAVPRHSARSAVPRHSVRSQCHVTVQDQQCHVRLSATSTVTSDTMPCKQCHISTATSDTVPRKQCHISSATSDTVPRQTQCHVRHSATSDKVPRQQCHVSNMTGLPGQLPNESLAAYKQRFQAQIEAEEQRQLAVEAARVQAEEAAAAEQLQLQADADADAQARRKEAQDLLQRHEANMIDRLKYWHFEPNGDEATPEEKHKEFLSKLVTRLLYACNYQQSELERQYQDLTQQHQELAQLRRMVQSHEDATQALNARLLDLEQAVPGPAAGASNSAPSSRQLEDRVDHVVAMLGDISTFPAPTTTISSQLHTLKTEVQQLQTTNADGNPKMYKMPTFNLERFDDYMQQDPVLWWEAFTTQLRILPVAKHAYIDALFLNSKGECQTWLSHLATSHGVDAPDLKDQITWEELTRLWKKRFLIDDAPTLAINRLFTMSQGNTTTRDWLTEWQKIAADCTSAMKKLKQALIEYPVLKVTNPSLPFVVTTDASQYGIGAVLQQDDGNGYRPVELMSARMPSEKVATSTYERELYALKQALEHWKHYLLGRHFKVYSDHETLRWLKTQAKMIPKLTRWAAEIDQYDFELKPVKGKYNVVADAPSRRADYFGAIVHYLDIGKDMQQKIREAYAQDPIYNDLIKKVKEAPETEPNYRTTEGFLFEKTNVFDRLCIPSSEEVPGLNLQDNQVLYIYSCALPKPIRGQLVAESKSGKYNYRQFRDLALQQEQMTSQVLLPGDDRRLRAETRARNLETAREAATTVERALAAAAASALAMATSAATSAANSIGQGLGMPTSSQSISNTSRVGTSQMAGSQFSSPPPRTREQMELQQVERIRLRLEEELRQTTKREKEIRDESVRLEDREADKAALEGLDDLTLNNNEKILKASILSMHAYMDSKLDTIQDTLDQILNAMHTPGIRPAVLPSLPFSATTSPYVVQSRPPPSGTSTAALSQTVASSSSSPSIGATPQSPPVSPAGQQFPWYPKTPLKPPPTFSGDKKDETQDTRLRTVRVWVRAKRTLVEEEVITVASYLEGSTTRWLNGLVASKGFGRNMVASGSAGHSGTVAAPNSDPAIAGSSCSFPYVDRKATQISSKYDGKDDIESWISSMRSYFDVQGTPPVTQSSVLGTNVEPAVRGFLEVQAVQSGYRLKLDKLKHNKWTDNMHNLQQYVSKLFATPDLEMTAQSCLDVIKGGCKVFSKIDLKFGYHQIEVDPADQHKTAFKTRDGLYEFIVMPFGLTNAPATFQSLMDKVFRNQINRFVVVYLDDILIFNKSMEEHMRHLEEVLQILKDSQLHLNLEKSEFGRDSVIYLGYRLSAAGLEPKATKVYAIRKWPQPVNVRELRSFLGLASYYRKFVPNFSIIARPLSRLTSKNVSYTWNEECTTALQALKEALASHPVLRIADPKLTFVVTTDASLYGIGAVLQQDDGDDLCPLEFYSKRMPSHKVAASTYMRKLYALREALDHWKHYLLGRHFKVFSYHETLKWIQTQTVPSTTLTRWLHEIVVYDFELRHKKGCYNRVADALSCHPEYMTCLVGS
ncbi:hypothetical protein CBR_g49909 [Chara braunii]|uniref:Reverse transcriptase domain-containing protein n=1 Tax=Chara braunii TaxID=69332 RepID=A0A388JPD3_CHABU|nr:hypothetical protein CBR_g49909 [Chara braunii]|eukprot:GBG59645.1 hypothetical protein CBR_g49909 [Chara braunii]